MKKFFFAALFLLLTCLPAKSQVSNLYLEARGGFDGGFTADYVNLVLEGQITPGLTYYWRQRFNKPLYNPLFPLNATDQLWIHWQPTDRWGFQLGKLPIVVGGYEYDDAPIDLYYWCEFANNMPDVYALGGAVWFTVTPQQKLMLHVTQSPFARGRPDCFQAGLVWMGGFTDWWQTIWSVNWVDDYLRQGMAYAGLGNRLEAGVFAAELDLMFRQSLRQRPGLDMSAILKTELSFRNQWKVFAKGGYDYNSPLNVDEYGNAYDLALPPGQHYWNIGGGVEYFPLRNDNLRLHLVGWTEGRRAHFTAGATYRLRIIRNKQ